MDSLFLRYASALMAIAKDENKIKEYKSALSELNSYFLDNEEIISYLNSYFVQSEDKELLVDKLCQGFELKKLSSFIKLLIKKHRFIKFKMIEKEFNRLANAELGIHFGFIYSVTPLEKKQIDEITSSISKRENHPVELVNKIDKNLIGGVKVVIEDRVYDGSIKNKLEAMENSISGRRITNEN